jgi:hypothetical protein
VQRAELYTEEGAVKGARAAPGYLQRRHWFLDHRTRNEERTSCGTIAQEVNLSKFGT